MSSARPIGTFGQFTEQCTRCGSCMAVCPVYRAGRSEDLVARGKLALLEGLDRGELAAGPELAKAAGRCLLCGRCQRQCPSGVDTPAAVMAAREVLRETLGAPLVKDLVINQVLTAPSRLDKLAALGGGLLRAVPALSGLRLRLPALAGVDNLPAPPGKSFLSDAPRIIPGPKGAPTVALFIGCVANYLRPQLAEKMTRLLSRRFELLIPPGQGCCGLPARAAGLPEAAASLESRNLAAFGQTKADLIITACGSCAHALVESLPSLAGKVREVSQVLCQEPALLAGLGQGKAAAVHDPCHLSVGLGVSEEPRAMLRTAGAEVVDMAGQDQCCGGGGLFSLAEPGLSQDIFQPRRKALQDCGAPVLATSCSGCWLQWRRGLDKGTQVVHPIELLDI